MNEFTFVAGMRLLFWISRTLGHWPFRLALYPVVLWYLVAKPAARASSQDYLRRLYASGSVGMLAVMRHFAAFGETLLDRMMLWDGLFKTDTVTWHGREQIATRIAAGQGALLICSHLGNLDLCRILASHVGLKLTLLIHTKHALTFNRLLAQMCPDSQANVQVTELSPATVILLSEKIARGELVVITGDRIPVSEKPRVAPARFLGAQALFPVGPYVLASLLDCPVYLVFSFRAGHASEVHFELFRESIRLPHQGRDEAFAVLAAEYAARLEHYCRRAPFQWFNFYDFWRRPALDAEHAGR
jgi:predicted LPLAT superfamily acyltransferase